MGLFKKRKRFRKRGYLGLNRPHSDAGNEFKPFGGFVKTAFAHESEQELSKSEKFDFYLHQEELIYKNITLDGSNETDLVRVYPETFDDILVGIARHLFKTGTKERDNNREGSIICSRRVLERHPMSALFRSQEVATSTISAPQMSKILFSDPKLK